MDGGEDPAFEQATFARIAWRLIPLLFAGYVAAFLDRVNVGFAKLQMALDLHFSDAVYGFGAGIFFIGYFLLEVPSNLALNKVGARLWMARIMLTWGLVSAAFVFVGTMRWGPIAGAFGSSDAQFTFYVLRFLLGAAEAGFYPGVILYFTFWFPSEYRARMIALFMSGIAVSNLIGSPISGAIMQFAGGAFGMRGWQWLFLLEAMPALILAVVFLAVLPDRPQTARWLSDKERAIVSARLARDEAAKQVSATLRAAVVFVDPRISGFATVYFCGLVCFYGVNFWMPTIVQELGIPSTDYLRVGLVSMIPWGFMIVAQVTWAHHSDKTGERRWHSALGLFVALAGLLLLAAVGHSPVLSLVGLTLITVGNGCWVVTFWSLPTSILGGTAAAAGIAWINSVGNLGGQFGPDIIGRVRDANGGSNTAAFLVLAAFTLAGALILLALPDGHRLKADVPA
uniref:MFS transporter n=1 Tax=Altererythrobacter segetis TaxID=1104773 RepID=UPI00140C5B66|nr:MFS transporter [Altererythrobacter segetis]